MSIRKPKPVPNLTQTTAFRLSDAEYLALAAVARRLDRTISYVVRMHLRELLQTQATT